MKITVQLDEVSHECLNSAVNDYSKLLNQHFVASGNSISLKDESDAYNSSDTYREKRYRWLIKATIEWVRVPIDDKQ